MKKLITLLTFVICISPAFSQLIINEVLYDPSNSALDGDANGDGVYDQEEDSFLEFINIGTSNFDASGLQIWDDTASGSLRYIIPAGTWIPPHGALVVFGGGTPTGYFGGAVVLTTDSINGMNLNNSGEIIIIRDSTGQAILSFDSDALSNNPNESYTRYPDITGNFIQHGDSTAVLFSPGTMVDGTPFDTVFVVMSIVVQGQNGVSAISTPGGTLQMEAIVWPVFADDTSVTWSVPVGNNVATISASGLLTAIGDGSVYVTAAANDGSGIIDSLEVLVTNQGVGMENLASPSVIVYPNPVGDHLYLNGSVNSGTLRILSMTGQLMIELPFDRNGYDVSRLKGGIYVGIFDTGNEQYTFKINKI